MKILMGLSLIALMVMIVSNVDFNNHLTPAAQSTFTPTSAAAVTPVEREVKPVITAAVKPKSAVRTRPSEKLASKPAPEVKATASPEPTEIPDSLKQTASTQKPAKRDPIMELRSSETVRPDDGPVLTLTYGDSLKFEHRSWTAAPNGNVKAGAAGALASDE